MRRVLTLAAGFLWAAGAGGAQDAELTILVDGALLAHGGVVEVTAVPASEPVALPQTITLTDRYAQVQILYTTGANYTYRFRPADAALAREGMEQFATEALSIGGRMIDGPDGSQEADWRSVRVLPFAEYGGADSASRTKAAWGETRAIADPPPANHWGARALPQAFETSENRRSVGLICEEGAAVTICTPDPADALLLEALWWRAIAEGRLERMRHDALSACYDSGGLLNRPERCDGVPGRGWPRYAPVE